VLPFDHGARLNRLGARQGILPTNHDIGRLDEARLIEFGRSAVAARKRRGRANRKPPIFARFALPRQKIARAYRIRPARSLPGARQWGGVPKSAERSILRRAPTRESKKPIGDRHRGDEEKEADCEPEFEAEVFLDFRL
jgi:hypothetical protein